MNRAHGIVLVGMRGSGKSTVGRLLAAELGLAFIDADVELEARAGESIAEIFDHHGERWFRDRERQLLLELLDQESLVLATGGGAVLHADVRAVLADRHTVWLSAAPGVLASRIAGSDRPSLTGAQPTDELATVLAARASFYEEVAANIVEVADRSPGSIADELADWWRSR